MFASQQGVEDTGTAQDNKTSDTAPVHHTHDAGTHDADGGAPEGNAGKNKAQKEKAPHGKEQGEKTQGPDTSTDTGDTGPDIPQDASAAATDAAGGPAASAPETEDIEIFTSKTRQRTRITPEGAEHQDNEGTSPEAHGISPAHDTGEGAAATGETPAVSGATGPAASGVESDSADTAASGADTHETIYIQLYSSQRKDTDFAAAWRTLAQKLKTEKNPHVVLDFSDVFFLYEKEKKYLVRMHETVQKCQATLTFVNCESDLRAMIMRDPLLVTHLSNE
jgi:hypothetical protein